LSRTSKIRRLSVLADALGEGAAAFAYLECVRDRGHEQPGLETEPG
jgi:hypothetical protein